MKALVRVGTFLSVLGTVHAAYNMRHLRVPPDDPAPVRERVGVLLPVRNEARRVEPCLRSLLAQQGVENLQIVILDDESTDDTAGAVRRIRDGDPRVRLLAGRPLPADWWGKPHACQQLAEAVLASPEPPTVLVFVDADVELASHAVASAVTLLRETRFDLVSPYPRQIAVSVSERLVQPLLQWSWLTTLPLRLAERSRKPSLSAANGQFLVIDSAAYQRAGGHTAVARTMVEDVGLLRALKRSGGRGTVVDGTKVATCRMYDGWPALRDGYVKSLWSAFGRPAGAAGATALLGVAYVVPPLAALRGSRTGLLGYVAAVVGRALVARRVASRAWPDVLAHPVSVAAFGWLTVLSITRHRRGTSPVQVGSRTS